MIRKRLALWLCAGAVLLLLLAISLRYVLQPDRVAGFVLTRLGASLGLEIHASGASDYRLRGTPSLLLRDVRMREPGATTALLTARRVYVSVPWATVRSRGEILAITRIELDAPVIQLPALQHWLAARPPSTTTRIPDLSSGLQVTDGNLVGDGWSIGALALSLPRLRSNAPVNARVGGRARIDATTAQFDLAVAMTAPANDAGVAVVGPIQLRSGDWSLKSRWRISGPLHADDDGIRIRRLRAAASAHYASGGTDLPFAFAITSPLQWHDGTLVLAPAGVAVRGKDNIPDIDATGAIAYGKRLLVKLGGRIASWPAAWPALPPPIGASSSALPFALGYLGPIDFTEALSLQVSRDSSRLDARLRAREIGDWVGNDNGSPLPPLTGRFTTPELEISGAKLEGVEVDIDNIATPSP